MHLRATFKFSNKARLTRALHKALVKHIDRFIQSSNILVLKKGHSYLKKKKKKKKVGK